MDPDQEDEETVASLAHLQQLPYDAKLLMLRSTELSAYKKYSVLYHARNDYGQSFVAGVQKLKPTYILTFKTQIAKVDIVSRQQIVIQTQSQIFFYRFTASDRFGQSLFQFSLKNALLFGYQLN